MAVQDTPTAAKAPWQARGRGRTWIARGLVVGTLLVLACAPAAQPGGRPAEGKPGSAAVAAPTAPASESLDQLYEKAKQEGGTLVFYSTMAQVAAEKLLPVFEERFPGLKVEHVDATGDKLVARAITEARGGRVLGDVFSATMTYVQQMQQQRLLLETIPPEASEYPDSLKGPSWVAGYLVFFVGAWNTNLVGPEEAPRQFEDFADPRWRNRLIAEPRDTEILLGLARHKYRNDDQAVELLRRIAANNVEFHMGHSELAELLTAGHAAACFTCYSHHFPSRVRRGAPVDYMLSEGVGIITATAVMKDAPHPNTAMLWYRWILSEEGQRAIAQSAQTPAHPKVEPTEKTRPERIYPLGADDMNEWNRYERLWKEVFQLR